ncbi:hypothetical protein [Flavobacterium agri]|nr:hypothetical protein [Flavobacterium agri]
MKTITQSLKTALSKTGKFPVYFALAAIFIMNTASTCEWEHDDDDSHHGSSQNISAINSAVNSGTWKVTYYFDTDSEETTQFASYTFTFGDNNQLVATDGSNSVQGTWSVTNSSGSSRHGDDDSSDVDFNIFFSSPGNFADLSDDWDIVLYTANRIELIDVSGGNGGTDILTFEKI